MNTVSCIVIFILFLLLKANSCGKALTYDVGCYKHRDGLLNHTAQSLETILLNYLPRCGLGGVWMHYQCNYDFCHCAYVDTGGRFFINVPAEGQPASRKYWAKACPIKSERRSDNCLEPPITYPCDVESIKYVYNASLRQCVPTRGCFGFSSPKKCKSVCAAYSTQQKLLGKCNSSINHGKNCDVQQPSMRYWFNSTSGMCQTFHHLGCGGNSNKHHSVWNCKRACEPQRNVTVHVHIEVGTIIRLIVPTWVAEKHSLSANVSCRVSHADFVDISRYAVSLRIYDSNNTDEIPPMKSQTEEETTSPQKGRSLPSICHQPPPLGIQCRANNNKWYYDSQKSECCRYSFCGRKPEGRNIFNTNEECSNVCSSSRD